MAAAYELADTDPRAMAVWIEALRKLTPGDKFALVIDMIEFMREAAIRQIRQEHPGIDEREVLWRLAKRRYGRELADRVYGQTY